MRYTIDNKKLYVTLEEELDYIRAYIEIYKKRFPGKGGEDYGIINIESRPGENFNVYLRIKKGKKYV